MATAGGAADREVLGAIEPKDVGIGRLFWAIRDAVVVGEAASGRIVLWSPSAEALFGYAAAEVVGRPIEILIPESLKERHRAGLAGYAATGRGALIDAGAPVELPARRKDGTEITVELTLSPIEESGVAGRFVLAILRDATERKRAEAERLLRARAETAKEQAEAAEARFRGLLEGVADAILVADAEGRYLDANRAAEELLGYTREELRGLGVADLVAAEAAWTAAEYARFVSDHRWRSELDLRRKDGTLVPVEAQATAVALPGETVYLAAIRDVSERRALERLQQDFVAMVGHDLRSPLTSLRGNAQLLKRRRAYDERAVDAILAQADWINRLVGDLADVVRLEAGGLELRLEAVDLAALAGEFVARARAEAPGRAVRLEAPADPIVGRFDRDRLGQVLQNLLGNALKYSPDGGEVVVRAEIVGDEARLSVADQGVGVPPEEVPRLFDRFYRAATAGSAPGLGLGLYIARMLVEAHGGRIWAESAPGRGSVFSVALALRAPAGEGEAASSV